MKRKNGFAIAGILYPLLVLFLCLILLVLGDLMENHFLFNKVKEEVENAINGESSIKKK